MLKSLEQFTEEMNTWSLNHGKEILCIYQNGNYYVCIMSDGTRIRETVSSKDTVFKSAFALNADVKILDRCSAKCKFCHEASSPDGKIGRLFDEQGKLLPIFDTWKPGTEIAIGGGNVFEHPQLEQFLTEMKSRGAICNITVNQRHIQQYEKELKHLIEAKLVYGIGISLSDSSNKKDFQVINEITKLSKGNVVIHVIVGLLQPKDVKALFFRKVLLLGYKNNVGRGVLFYQNNQSEIIKNTEWLKANLYKLKNVFQVMSFDNLALAQLDVRSSLKLSDEEWQLRYQGADYGKEGLSTFYYDAVQEMIGRSSTQPYNERIKYTGQTFQEAFEASLSNYKVTTSQYGEIVS